MKPDIRPVKELTLEILCGAPYWSFIWLGRLLTVATQDIYLVPIRKHSPVCVAGVFLPLTDLCYPCIFDPLVGIPEPTPWPIAEGEEEIVEWEGIDHSFYARVITEWGNSYWRLYNEAGTETGFEELIPRPGHRPAPRIGKDGKTVWVWEVYCER